MDTPPVAPRRPHVVTAHGDNREDPWFWLREREDPAVLAYLEAENAYTEATLEPLAALREGLFEEMKARIKETDMSVPVRRGPWWYYTRTEEGESYAIHCRRPARGPGELPPAGEPGEEEQILLDENALAEGSDYFAVGSAAVSHDHRWLAYSTDRAGDEKYELRFTPLDAGTAPAVEVVPETGYGLAWSALADYVFYVRLDEALRPFQLWRHRLGRDPGSDVLVLEEPDRRFALGVGTSRDEAFVLVGLHSTNTTEWLAIPAGRPEEAPRVLMARREGVEYGVDHLSRGEGRGLVRGADQRGRARLPRPRRPRHRPRGHLARGGAPPARRARRGRGRVRLGARAERALRGPDRGAGAPARRHGRPLRRQPPRPRAGSCPPWTARPPPGSGPTPNPIRSPCASGAPPW